MKKSLLTTLTILLIGLNAYCQSVTIEPGSVLPKMTTAQRTAMGAADDGTLVFDINTQSYWYRSVGNWVEINESGSGTPPVPESLPKVASQYQAISLPNETVTSSNLQMELSDTGTACIGYSSDNSFHILLIRNGETERYNFNKGNSTKFNLVINDNDQVLMVYDSTVSGDKRLKYRMFDGTSWQANGLASPAFTNILEYSYCLNDNGRAYIAWTQQDVVTRRVFLSSYDGTSWSHPANYFDYFNPDWGVASAVNPCFSPTISMANNNEALLTWRQTISGTAHAFKAENDGTSWSKPISSSDYIDVPPTADYDLIGVKSSQNEQGDACVFYTYRWDDFVIDFSNFSFKYDLKTSGTWTNDITFSSFNYSYIADFATYQTSLKSTNADGFYMLYFLRISDFGGSFILTNSKTLTKLTSTAAGNTTHNFSTQLNEDFLSLSVDVNSNANQQYTIRYPLVAPSEYQLFSLYDSFSSVSFGYEDYESYVNDYTENAPGSYISRLSENNRTRGVAWIQNDGTNNRLYMSFID